MSTTSVMKLLLFDTTKRKDSFRSTILSFAAGYGCKELVKAMIDSGTDVNKPNVVGYSPLTCAIENGSMECVSLILQAGAAVNYETPIVREYRATMAEENLHHSGPV